LEGKDLDNTHWLKNWEYVELELKQATEEGKDVSAFQSKVEAVMAMEGEERENAAKALMDEFALVMVNPDFPYNEPSSLPEIREQRPEGPRKFDLSMSEEALYDKIYGAWLGRCAGCLLGKPVEGIGLGRNGREKLTGFLKATNAYPLNAYFNFNHPDELLKEHGFNPGIKHFDALTLGKMPEDDDTNYTVIGLRILEHGGLNFTPDDVGQMWLTHFPILHTCTAERVAYRNISNLILPPESAMYHNPYREWIGAQIRADMWGYVTPGNPELGAEFAWRDACISHVKNGIYGEMFVAAMLSAAFVTDDAETVVRTGLSEIPANSRLAEAIRDLLDWWKKDSVDWEKAIDMIYEKYGHYHPVHTINNALLVCAGILYGQLDFGKSIGIAVGAALDTDCNGATVGSIVGMMLGAKRMPEYWTTPLQDTLETGVHGYNIVPISKAAEYTLKVAQHAIETYKK
jgi:ADP-ribosylglycohydrolase